MDPKHITRTSFCNKEIDNVTDNSMKKYILDNLKIKTNLDYNTRYAKIFNEQYINNYNILVLYKKLIYSMLNNKKSQRSLKNWTKQNNFLCNCLHQFLHKWL